MLVLYQISLTENLLVSNSGFNLIYLVLVSLSRRIILLSRMPGTITSHLPHEISHLRITIINFCFTELRFIRVFLAFTLMELTLHADEGADISDALLPKTRLVDSCVIALITDGEELRVFNSIFTNETFQVLLTSVFFCFNMLYFSVVHYFVKGTLAQRTCVFRFECPCLDAFKAELVIAILDSCFAFLSNFFNADGACFFKDLIRQFCK